MNTTDIIEQEMGSTEKELGLAEAEMGYAQPDLTHVAPGELNEVLPVEMKNKSKCPELLNINPC